MSKNQSYADKYAEAAMEQQAILLQRAWNTAGGESLPQSVVLSKIGLYLI